MKISIIVAVRNGEKTLQQCIDSVTQQTYVNRELIVIDGGSNDNTVELLKANDGAIHCWLSEPDGGIYNAWNKGLSRANGDWICFIGADDFLWSPNVLEHMSVRLIKMSPAVNVAYSKVMLVNSNGEHIYVVGKPWKKIKQRFKQVMCIPHPGTMHRNSLFKKIGNFDETFRIAGDYELLLRELKSGDAIFVNDIIIAGMRQGGISGHPKNTLISLLEARRAQRMHGQSYPGLHWLMAYLRVRIRMMLWILLGETVARGFLDFGRRAVGLKAFWSKTQ